MILLPQKVVYRGTISSLRISSVDGTAFLDNCAALVPYADGLHRVEIYDSAGRQLVGYLSAQGSGETYSDLIYGATNNGNMETGSPPTGWLIYNATISRVADERTGGAGSYSINVNRSSANGYCYCSNACTLGMLYTYGGYIKNVSATNGLIDYRNAQLISASGDWTLVSGYRTGDVTVVKAQFNLMMSGPVGVDVRFDDVFLRQVLTPSTDGCTIVSTKSGAVQNFASKDASFTYNAATNYVVVRKAR